MPYKAKKKKSIGQLIIIWFFALAMLGSVFATVIYYISLV